MRNRFFVIIILYSVWSWGDAAASSNQYIGSDSCKSCHEIEHQQWQTSDHHKAMQSPSAESVLGDFSNKTVEFHNIKSRFFVEDKQYFVETQNKQGKTQIFPVIYTFGFDPLQQYILDTGNGHMQAFNIAWDTRPDADGGQRWYHLQPDESITNEHPFFWQRHFQNWNSRCAECHTTGYDKNYQLETNSYATQFAEATVGCESCHGPAALHQTQATSNKFDANKGFTQQLIKPPIWGFAPNDPIANLVSERTNQYMQQCADCHSRRLPIADKTQTINNAPTDYHDTNSLSLLSTNLYFDDGQIKDEVFVMGSFLQSKMAKAGVTCSNCHNPHSGKLKLPGNQTCTQCHSAATFDIPEHHQHKADSLGSQCVECHMPSRTYMQVDDRRDHSFVLPNAAVSAAIDSPNACMNCHQKEDLPWVATQLAIWRSEQPKSSSPLAQTEHWTDIHRLPNSEQLPFAKQQLTKTSPIVAAKLLEIINRQPSQESVTLAIEQLNSQEPLLRRAAIDVLRALPPNQGYQYLYPMLKDPVKSVRFHASSLLASWLSQIPETLLPELSFAIEEYTASLLLTADFPTSQLSLAQLALAMGDNKKAQQHFEQALIIAPNLPIAMLSLADYWRQTNNQTKELAILEKAVAIHHDFADVFHQYGLFWVRKKEYYKAAKWLVKASEQNDAQPYYAYVAATALDTIKRTTQAVDMLLQANRRWPQQNDLLYSLALYSEKTKNEAALKMALKDLRSLMPNNPQVQQWSQQYDQ
ncbi:MAG: multiheme c-type cytochrome [Paraglaciecola sp.]|uniref:multiheme c-type cytochrome n=1 Tax=Paraglaciecola sp. TaxID=1920173 RepID=UPI003298377E